MVVFLAIDGPAGWVSDRGVDIFEGNGEVDQVEVKVLDAPICQLLLGDLLDLVAVMEGIPELADDE